MIGREDLELVREYVENGSEEAFAEVVRRHINLVHSVARRSLNQDHGLAEEVTQATFLIFARKAKTFSAKTIVSAWLCRTAQYVAADARKARSRQKRRELESYMDSLNLHESEDQSSAWNEIAPALDEAMGQLNERDHAAIVLRFFEGKDFGQVAASLGVQENAARTRVSRALEKLRHLFQVRGVHLSTVALGSALAAQSVSAAPIGLAGAVASAACTGVTISANYAHLITNTLKIMAWSKAKSAIILALLIAAGGLGTIVVYQNLSPKGIWEFTNAGYATPENTMNSILWAASQGDMDKAEKGITAEELRSFDLRMAGKSQAAIRAGLIKWAEGMKGYDIVKKEEVSADEVLLHIRAAPSKDALHTGKATIRMVRVNGAWMQAGTVN